jgi:hypothetical protein
MDEKKPKRRRPRKVKKPTTEISKRRRSSIRSRKLRLDERVILIVEKDKKEFILTCQDPVEISQDESDFILFKKIDTENWSLSYSKGILEANKIDNLKIVKEFGFFK